MANRVAIGFVATFTPKDKVDRIKTFGKKIGT